MQFEVVCHDPSHARGKIAKIATFTVTDSEVRRRFIMRNQHFRRQERRKRIAIAEAMAQHHKKWFAELQSGVEPRGAPFETQEVLDAVPQKPDPRDGCKLCGRRLPLESAELHAVIRQLAEDGVTTVSLSELVARLRSRGTF